MRFLYSNSILKLNTILLVKDENTILELSNNNYIKYLGIHYTDQAKVKTYFIGKYVSYKSVFTYQNEIIGVYIRPHYIYLNNEWFKIINYQDLKNENKQILYPHLITICSYYSEFNPLPYAYSIELCSNLNEIDELNIKEINL